MNIAIYKYFTQKSNAAAAAAGMAAYEFLFHTQMQTYPETNASYAHRALHTLMLFFF